MDDFLCAVENLKSKNLYRELIEYDALDEIMFENSSKKKLISFASNDYLGLSHNSLVKKAALEAINKYGVSSAASRYISGNNSLYTKLEKQIARMKNCDDAIVFSSGYQCAIGVVPALVTEGDLAIADKLIHSSLLDGVKLSGAKLIRFSHNNIKHVDEIIQSNAKKYRKILIITETIFSMDGDVAPILELQKLAQKNNCLFLTDAAHDIDFAGLKPYSKISAKAVAKLPSYNFHLQMGTLSKAVGSFGGYVAGDKIIIDYLRNFAKSAIYTTALPPATLAASLQSLKIISQKKLSKKVLENAKYFCELMNLSQPQSAIVIIKIGDNKKVLEIKNQLITKGFLISAIRPPTVEPKGARLRITFSSQHKKSQIEKLAKELQKLL